MHTWGRHRLAPGLGRRPSGSRPVISSSSSGSPPTCLSIREERRRGFSARLLDHVAATGVDALPDDAGDGDGPKAARAAAMLGVR